MYVPSYKENYKAATLAYLQVRHICGRAWISIKLLFIFKYKITNDVQTKK